MGNHFLSHHLAKPQARHCQMNFLQHHPFAVKAHFDQSLVLAYAVPAEELRPHVPAPLQLDLFQDSHAFIALAMVETSLLRPSLFPKFLGRSFTLLGYRAFVRYTGADGRTRRGLYILRSETDSPFMTFSGNIFTQYCYKTVKLNWQKFQDGSEKITTNLGLEIETAPTSEEPLLPPESIFPDWRQARRFAGPMPFTFSHDPETQKMISVEGVRQKWTPGPIEIHSHKVPYFDQFNFTSCILANAFTVQDIPYLWKKGTTEHCP
ncbi:MAG: hypothetical protein ACI9E1_000347 [Cryomorphaceae bacterium]